MDEMNSFKTLNSNFVDKFKYNGNAYNRQKKICGN